MKNSKKKKFLCPECHKEYVKHPDMLCYKCYELYVFDEMYPYYPEDEERKK